jgi:hypothetical protein
LFRYIKEASCSAHENEDLTSSFGTWEMKFVLFKGTQRRLLPVLSHTMWVNYRGNIRQSFTSCRHSNL